MIFKHPDFKDDKHYSVCSSSMGMYVVREFINKCKKTELTMNPEERLSFIRMLKNNGWSEV